MIFPKGWNGIYSGLTKEILEKLYERGAEEEGGPTIIVTETLISTAIEKDKLEKASTIKSSLAPENPGSVPVFQSAFKPIDKLSFDVGKTTEVLNNLGSMRMLINEEQGRRRASLMNKINNYEEERHPQGELVL
jgi:hypothetical protein